MAAGGATYRPLEQQHSGWGASKGFSQLFGLDPRIAFLTFLVDAMLTPLDLTGVLIPISLMAGVVLGWIAYRAQMKWYGDDRDSAMIKAATIALLTAIPAPIPSGLYLASGIVGLVHNLRRK